MTHLNSNTATKCFLVLLLFILLRPGEASSDSFPGVCQQGTGIPPFLSSSVKPNLLMVLDNSGSMLDMAYVKATGECTDNSYDDTATYAGLFDDSAWYQWTDGQQQWFSGAAYSAGDIVYTEGVFYKATSSGTSTSSEIADDNGVQWERVGDVSVWQNGIVYGANSFAQDSNQLYYTIGGGTATDNDPSDGTNILGDTGITDWEPVDSTWRSGVTYAHNAIVSDKGFLYRAAGAGTSSGTNRADDTGVTWTRLNEGHFAKAPFIDSAGAAVAFSGASGTAYMSDALYAKITTVDNKQSGVTAFAAKGNLLNWASSSKFDIQKKILTGGKYDVIEQELISQSRGCSSRSFLKEVSVQKIAAPISNAVITFSINGPQDEDYISTTDNTTRLSILGTSDNGFINSDQYIACETAVDEIAKGDDGSLGTIQTNAKVCLAYDTTQNNVLAASNAAYNHSVQTCWKKVGEDWADISDMNGGISDIQNACEHIYNYNVPPSTIDYTDSGGMCYGVYASTIDHANRDGYIGRCWTPGTVPAGCLKKACETATGSGPHNDPRCFPDGYEYKCSGTLDKYGECKKEWEIILIDDPDIAGVCDTSQAVDVGGWATSEDSTTCIKQGIWDYCQRLEVPEVIDPSDQVFDTGENWGMIGALVEAGAQAFFGTGRPLLVTKGYIQQASPPEGILDEVADHLRIGAMAFNENGAMTECGIATSSGDDTIVRFCPDQNRDGAKVIAGISDTTTNPSHLDDLKIAINDIRATAWTPLAEAVYNALGYYGQNSSFQLDPDDFNISASDDPVQYWCQENYLLVITEGASTADLHSNVRAKISALDALGVSDDTISAENEAECKGGTDANDHDLFGSTYLDDLTYLGQHAQSAGIYTTPTITTADLINENKRNITTYLVVAGTPRDEQLGANEECNPLQLMKNSSKNGGTNLYTGEDPAQLEGNLKDVFSDILSRVSAGSAASVISSSRSGEGAVYQAIFWPEINRAVGEDPLLWVGDVHSFFIDEHGQLWDDYSSDGRTGELWTEDTNGNGLLDPGEDLPNGNVGVLDGDRRIITFYNQATSTTQICFNPTVRDTGVCEASDYANTPLTVELRDFSAYLWSAKNNLENLQNLTTNRNVLASGLWDFTTQSRRYIFTWNDLDNDGIVDFNFDGFDTVDDDGDGIEDRNEVLPFVSGMSGAVTPAINPRQSLVEDFNLADSTELNKLINWIRGESGEYENDTNGNGILEATEDINGNGVRDYVFRCRKTNCNPTATDSSTWLLGDVIHSTPTLVGRPAEGYHYIYQDSEYAQFYKKYLNRRHVIYFGGNDGMLHAVNGGFYQAGLNKFTPCRPDQRTWDTTDPNNPFLKCTASAPYDVNAAISYPALGDELWAYIPYNLQPQLSCLTDPEYDHKYFVDGPPRVFDVRIFPDDDVHPGGWGTILVGYMRFGGSPVVAEDDDPATIEEVTPNRRLASSYFILDITDPERPPTLLAEMTMDDDTEEYISGSTVDKYTDMGFTTAMPTVVVMRDKDGKSEWFLVFGNGPTTIAGENTSQGKVATIPLNSITGVNWKTGNGTYVSTDRQPFRIPNRNPVADDDNDQRHFGRFLIPADSNSVTESFTGDFVTVDFDIGPGRSTTDSTTGKIPYKSDAVYFGTVDGSVFNTSGSSYWDGDGRLFRLVTKTSTTDDSITTQDYAYPATWELHKLIDAEGPITAAPNIGFDDNNFWIYFGTGRFFDPEDKTDDATQYFFGIKEPLDSTCNFTWGDIDWSSNPDPSNAPGAQGLLRTDPVRVVERKSNAVFGTAGDYVYCHDWETNLSCTLPLSPLTVTLPDPLQGDDSEHQYYSFNQLKKYIQGEKCTPTTIDDDDSIGIDGWYRHFYDPRERSLGMPTLLGGLVTYTSYQPFADLCKAEGSGYLYGVYFLTGTAWYENVFGTYQNSDSNNKTIVKDRLSLGKGLATTPSIQVGTGPDDATAFIQTSTGEIIEIGQETLPINNTTSGRTSWRNK